MISLGLVNQQLFCLDMVQYTLAQSPEIILTVPGKDSAKAREKAMDQLMELMEAGNLPTELEEGFGAQQLIEVKEASIDTGSGEDAITQAVQVLSNLATLKLKVQDSRAEALEIRKAVDVLFSDQSVTEEEITRLKEGFKVLKNFAQANIRYQEARTRAEQARLILDQALKSPEK
jgi:soluble cytochrome b562